MPPMGASYFYPRPPRGGRPSYAHRSPDRCYFYPRPPRGGRPTVRRRIKLLELFLSTPSARRATSWLSVRWAALVFLSTPSARRATADSLLSVIISVYFYPRPPRGGRPFLSETRSRTMDYFYPRPPRGGRPPFLTLLPSFFQFLSTPSARRATNPYHCSDMPLSISIHALREEGDHCNFFLSEQMM